MAARKKAGGAEMVPKASGRPTKWRPEFDARAFEYASLGATSAEMAKFFGVDVSTIIDWSHTHPSFSKSLRQAREEADARVVKSLFHRALGYTHPDTHICTSQGKVFETPITKHYPPDTSAIIFYLCNRNPKQWKRGDQTQGGDRSESIEAIRALVGALLPKPAEGVESMLGNANKPQDGEG